MSSPTNRKDAVGWLDYHLHELRRLDAAERNVVSIGIATDHDPDDRPVVPDGSSLCRPCSIGGWHAGWAMYAYDFGDDWKHALVHEGVEPATNMAAGSRAVLRVKVGAPEDYGDVHGYAESPADHRRPPS